MFVFEFRIKKLTNLWRLLVGVPVVVLFVIFSRGLGLVLFHSHVFTDLPAACLFGFAVATELDHVEAFWTAAFAGLALLANTAPLPPTSVHACTIRVVKQGSRGLTIQKGGKQGGGEGLIAEVRGYVFQLIFHLKIPCPSGRVDLRSNPQKLFEPAESW